MKRIITSMLASVIVLSAVTGCSANNSDIENNIKISKGKIYAEKVASYTSEDLDNIIDYSRVDDGLYYYTDSNSEMARKYGIINSKTNKVEAPIYTYIEGCKKDMHGKCTDSYYMCTKAESSDTISDMNSVGLISTSGEEIIPQKYAHIILLNNRYAQVITAEAETKNQDEAVLYQNTTNIVSLGPSDSSLLYKGYWEVYDIKEKKTVKGIKETVACNIEVFENIIQIDNEFYNKNGEEISCDEVFENGAYTVVNGKETTVYNSESEELFSYNNEDVKVTEGNGEFFIKEENNIYYEVDSKDEKVTIDFDDKIKKVGSLYQKRTESSNYSLFNAEGKKIVDDEISECKYNKKYDLYIVEDVQGEIIYLNSDAEILGSVNNKSANGFKDSGVFYNSRNSVYSFADQDYTIDGEGSPSPCSPFVFENDICAISTFDGSVIVPEEYSSIVSTNNGIMLCKKTDGSADLYRIKY